MTAFILTTHQCNATTNNIDDTNKNIRINETEADQCQMGALSQCKTKEKLCKNKYVYSQGQRQRQRHLATSFHNVPFVRLSLCLRPAFSIIHAI